MELITGTWWVLRKALFWVKEHQKSFKSAFWFLCYKNTRLWLSAVIVLHWVDFGVQRKYVNSVEFYLEEKAWPGCRTGRKPPGGRGDWTNRRLSEWQCLGLFSRLGKRPDITHLSSSLVSSSGFFRNRKAERREDSCRYSNRPKYSAGQLKLLHQYCIEKAVHNLTQL